MSQKIVTERLKKDIINFVMSAVPKVFVAMSGGVDSSVAAALLKRAGFDVVGVFMKFWSGTQINTDKNTNQHKWENRCCSIEAQEDARRVAAKLGIPLYTLNLEKEFKKAVVDYFLKEYRAGRTPNPCVVCNKEIKFGLLLKKALALKADFVATGHYVRVRVSPSKRHSRSPQRASAVPLSASPPSPSFAFQNWGWDHAGEACERLFSGDTLTLNLLKARDLQKDQSYFLWALTQKQLARVLFPIGDYTKSEVRKMAKKWGLPVAEKPESQEICFIPDGDLNRFLKCHLKTKKGPIITIDGNLIGEHQGLVFYTIGQRKGIKIPGREPYFVVDKDNKTNTLIVAPLSQKSALLKKELIVKNVNWISGKEPRLRQGFGGQAKLPVKVAAKIRYRQKTASASLTQIYTNKNTNSHRLDVVKVKFDQSQRAITPGQSIVFYKGGELLGGGTIDKKF